MKKFAVLPYLALSLLFFTACNDDTAVDEQMEAAQAVSLNDIQNTPEKDGDTPMQNAVPSKQVTEVILTVPDSAWSMQISDVVESENETAVIVQLDRNPDVMGMQVISERIAAVECTTAKPIKVYVLGKTWGWKNQEDYVFIKDAAEINGESIPFQLVEASRKGGPKRHVIEDIQ